MPPSNVYPNKPCLIDAPLCPQVHERLEKARERVNTREAEAQERENAMDARVKQAHAEAERRESDLRTIEEEIQGRHDAVNLRLKQCRKNEDEARTRVGIRLLSVKAVQKR
jgi:hypothetical protein